VSEFLADERYDFLNVLTMLFMQSYKLKILIALEDAMHVPKASERRGKRPRYIADC